MLVLSRKVDEVIVFTLPTGEIIKIVVTSIDRGKVRLGFIAPQHVRIVRSELLENDAANKTTNGDK